MICRQCGTEIADRALVCYRCGRATADTRVVPVRRARPAGRVPAAAALLVLALGALYMSQAASGDVPRALSWIVAALASVVLGWWWVWRRRR